MSWEEVVRKEFKDYIIADRTRSDGVGMYGIGTRKQIVIKFSNGYGASVVDGQGSYGLELAVLVFDGNSYSLTYNTPITDDVLGHLTNEELIKTLHDIKQLKGE